MRYELYIMNEKEPILKLNVKSIDDFKERVSLLHIILGMLELRYNGDNIDYMTKNGNPIPFVFSWRLVR